MRKCCVTKPCRPNVLKTDFSLIGQYSRFTHPDKVNGDRFVFYPQVSLPVVHPAFQITPKFGLHMTSYKLDRPVSGTEETSFSRALPTFSLDSTMVFEREGKLLDNEYIQTLEPRLYYVNIPYRDQNNAKYPVFDSGLTDFNFAQIFSENRYSGFDRINDANQLTAALTTRILDASTGVERFKAMVGQRYYFNPQKVSLPGEVARPADFSNFVAAVTGLVLPKTYADVALEYNFNAGTIERFSAGSRFQPELGKVLSASYRYASDPLTQLSTVSQVDIGAQWPLSAQWFAVGRFNYSLRVTQSLFNWNSPISPASDPTRSVCFVVALPATENPMSCQPAATCSLPHDCHAKIHFSTACPDLLPEQSSGLTLTRGAAGTDRG